ncbi:hypothetical protein GCM10009841_23110 [Microlunatus panaciterrae]|uniref:Uncharacterized protein n=1 Tax=Microlunatus panaciterrae TaxID=400768 RepID=A0ABS2RET5_9ACTN|nr:hypothetical protein [Microlunatus panaciterrae]MBM7797193.1 hypothetical protein [Microlunatus panaciterrae]
MVSKVGVIVSSDFRGDSMVRLVESMDAQTLPYAEFQVVFVPGTDQDPALMDRVEPLTRNRPNVRCHATGPLTATDLDAEYLLLLSPERQGPNVRLLPEALERLYGQGERHQADAVVGRCGGAVGDGISGVVFLDDHDSADGLSAGSAATWPCLLVRRSVLVDRQLSLGGALEIPPDVISGRVAVLGSYPALVGVDLPGAVPAPELIIAQPGLSWQSGVLTIKLSAQAPTEGIGGEVASAQVRCSVRQQSTGLEWWLPTDGTVAMADGQLEVTATARVDPLTAALGASLEPGIWVIRLGVYGLNHLPDLTAPVPMGSAPAAVINGTLVAVVSADGSLAVDVGCTGSSPVGRVDALNAKVAETVAGTLLTLALPAVHVVGQSVTAGSILLGKFRLPARLVCDGSSARVESFVSGLAGSSPIATRFGPSGAAQTGLALNILATGGMTLEKVRPRKAAVRPRRPASTKLNRAGAPRGIVATLRRRVPAPLEPAVRALARNEMARSLYRRLTRR